MPAERVAAFAARLLYDRGQAPPRLWTPRLSKLSYDQPRPYRLITRFIHSSSELSSKFIPVVDEGGENGGENLRANFIQLLHTLRSF